MEQEESTPKEALSIAGDGAPSTRPRPISNPMHKLPAARSGLLVFLSILALPGASIYRKTEVVVGGPAETPLLLRDSSRLGPPELRTDSHTTFIFHPTAQHPGGNAAFPKAAAATMQTSEQKVIFANPSNYLARLKRLRPGNTLLLEAGIYDNSNDVPGLPIFDLNGEPGKPIVITGPETGPFPVFRARPDYNTIRFARSSYVIVSHLELDGRNLDADAVNAQGVSHHITIEHLLIRNHGADQQTVAISTKAPAWEWVIRNNVILGAGTGIYLGNSDGTAPFVGGLIENNLIVDTIGYNLEIKHQKPRPDLPGLPTDPCATIIRHNVFGKEKNSSTDEMARPNVLVGHFPLAGPGAEDVYLVYGNFFYQNPSDEPLFQGEGNIALYNNLFVNRYGDAIRIQPHKAFPRRIHIFYNTVVAQNTGIFVKGGSDSYRQMVIGNVVFASTPIQALDQKDNITGSLQAARRSLTNPDGPLGELDLFPKPEKVTGRPIDTSLFHSFPDWNQDFNGNPRQGHFRGAYAGEGKNPGWLPKLEIKPVRPTGPFSQTAFGNLPESARRPPPAGRRQWSVVNQDTITQSKSSSAPPMVCPWIEDEAPFSLPISSLQDQSPFAGKRALPREENILCSGWDSSVQAIVSTYVRLSVCSFGGRFQVPLANTATIMRVATRVYYPSRNGKTL